MSKLRVVTFAILLLLVIAVGCSSSDQGAIDKAVSATLAVQQGVIETAVASGIETALADNVEPTATVAPTATPEAAKEYGCSSIERVDIEARDEFGGTLLHMAAQKNSLDVARQLIDSGADIEARDKSTKTPLHQAAESNSLDVASLLIDRCADSMRSPRTAGHPYTGQHGETLSTLPAS